jgi:hypothetical protein
VEAATDGVHPNGKKECLTWILVVVCGVLISKDLFNIVRQLQVNVIKETKMLVKDLIKILDEMPYDAEVFIDYKVDFVDPVVELVVTDCRNPYVILNK